MEISELFLDLKPYSTAVHAASAIVGMGAALTSDIMFSFYARDRVFDAHERRTFERLSKIVWIALIAIIVSGLALFLSDPVAYSASSKFLIKMTVVAVLTINGYVLSRWIQPHIARGDFLISSKERRARMLAFSCGAISLVSWCSAFGLGMLSSLPLSYAVLAALYAMILAGAIAVALVIERAKFE